MIKKEFYFSTVLNDIHNLGSKRAGYDYVREAIFIRLLSFSAGGVEFTSPRHFSQTIGCPENQCILVWEYCVGKGILSDSQNGMSALPWLASAGYSNSRQNRANLPPVRDLEARPIKDTADPEIPPKEGQISQAIGIAETQAKPSLETAGGNAQTRASPPARPALVKEAVRPNVWLDRDELSIILKSVTQEELTECLDLYSNWKGRKGTSRDINDFKQINSWVIRAVRQRKQNGRNPRDVNSDDFQEFLNEYVKDKK